MKPLRQYDGLDSVEPDDRPLHLAIGMFDGVHCGHQTVIRRAVASAQAADGRAAVFSFRNHPSRLLHPERPTRLLMPVCAKRLVLQRLGVESLILQPFTREFARQEAEEFLPSLRRDLPSLRAVYVGENWRFGRGRRGDVALLQRVGESLGIKIVSVPRLQQDGSVVSSTRIRNLLTEGEIAAANTMLGFPYFSIGRVKAGKGLGKKIGVPTLNLAWVPELLPRFGVYATRLRRVEEARSWLSGVSNFGLRPTVESATEPRLETHVFQACDFQPGDTLVVEWHSFIREEMKFDDVGALVAQINQDIRTARQWWGEQRANQFGIEP